jgi:hypothetical protein
VKTAVAAVSLVLGQLPAANVEAGLDCVLAAGKDKVAYVLEGILAAQNRQ